MGSYSLRITVSAAKELEAIPDKKTRQAVTRRIQGLAENPRPQGCEKLVAGGDRYRVRQGVYRILYAIEDRALVVWVIKIGHRREIYRGIR